MQKQIIIYMLITIIAVSSGCLCPRNYNPVCDNENNQHGNICLFECALKDAQKNGREIKIMMYGECKKVSSKTCETERIPYKKMKPPFERTCSFLY
ncbi:uncharacterized protein LOC106635943 [Copidosoma floridanum]|uniref:uncharacterized protein LOC106635943 n=1 Tax=Copidosoma floridanum TaxID=29053 RepID=UPI0006C99B5C|nr:uncharacterized protein LOC106635943 [Copidosoma floridanum]